MGKNWFEVLVPKERYPQVWQEHNRLLTGGIVQYFENPILTKDGEERIITWSNSKVSVKDETIGTISFGIDITSIEAEEALKESEKRFRNLMEQTPVSIQIHSPAGTLVQSNAAYARLYALNEETLAELYDKYNVLQDEQAKKLGVMPFIEKAFEGEEVVFPAYEYDGVDTLKTLDFNKPISRKCWVQTHGFPLRDKNGTLQVSYL